MLLGLVLRSARCHDGRSTTTSRIESRRRSRDPRTAWQLAQEPLHVMFSSEHAVHEYSYTYLSTYLSLICPWICPRATVSPCMPPAQSPSDLTRRGKKDLASRRAVRCSASLHIVSAMSTVEYFRVCRRKVGGVTASRRWAATSACSQSLSCPGSWSTRCGR